MIELLYLIVDALGGLVIAAVIGVVVGLAAYFLGSRGH